MSAKVDYFLPTRPPAAPRSELPAVVFFKPPRATNLYGINEHLNAINYKKNYYAPAGVKNVFNVIFNHISRGKWLRLLTEI